MDFQSICSICRIENKPRDGRKRTKIYPLGMSQKWVLPCPDQEIIHARVVHLKKWVIPCLEWDVIIVSIYIYKGRTQKMGNSRLEAKERSVNLRMKFCCLLISHKANQILDRLL